MPATTTCPVCGASFGTADELMAHSARAHPSEGNMKPAWPPSVNRRGYLRWSAVGGFVGGIALALVMMAAGQIIVGDGVAVVCSMGVALIGLQATSTPTTILGLLLHFVAAIVIGLVLGAITLVVRHRFAGRFAITNPRNGAAIGLLGGFFVWLVFGLPLMTFVLAPAMVQVMGMMMPGSMMMAEEEAKAALSSAGFIGAWLVGHLLYGLLWGTTAGYAATRKSVAGAASSISRGVPR
jgi:C2H2-type zinc finger